jgi:hypothetical protein
VDVYVHAIYRRTAGSAIRFPLDGRPVCRVELSTGHGVSQQAASLSDLSSNLTDVRAFNAPIGILAINCWFFSSLEKGSSYG